MNEWFTKLCQRVRIEIDPFNFCFQFPKSNLLFSLSSILSFTIWAHDCLFLVNSTEFESDFHLIKILLTLHSLQKMVSLYFVFDPKNWINYLFYSWNNEWINKCGVYLCLSSLHLIWLLGYVLVSINLAQLNCNLRFKFAANPNT